MSTKEERESTQRSTREEAENRLHKHGEDFRNPFNPGDAQALQVVLFELRRELSEAVNARGRDKREALLREEKLREQVDTLAAQSVRLLEVIGDYRAQLAYMQRPLIPTAQTDGMYVRATAEKNSGQFVMAPTGPRCPQCDLVGACSCGGA